MEESDSEDSEDLNKETNGENSEDDIRVPIERKEARNNEKEKKDSNLKERKLRNNASEDEDDTESELEEELKKLRKVKIERAEEDKKQQRM
ncbi:hypothetical protein Tco_0793844 [Tanacetum coccineum]